MENSTLEHCYFSGGLPTGICIDKIYFEPCQDGMLATHAEVNRNSEEYGETDNEADIQRIREMLAYQGVNAESFGNFVDTKNYLASL